MGSNEIFLGGLPRAAARLAAIEAALHDKLMETSGTSDPSAVRLRLHTDAAGEGLGFGFAWLPDADAAKRLVQAAELTFDLDGFRTRAGVRAARGRPGTDQRPPPSSEPGLERLSVAIVAPLGDDCSLLERSFAVWRMALRRFGVGLEVQSVAPAADGDDDEASTLHQLERARWCDVVLLLWRAGAASDARVQQWAVRLQAMGDAGRAVLVVETTPGDPHEAPHEASHEAPHEALPSSGAEGRSLVCALRELAERATAAGASCRVDAWSDRAVHELYPWTMVRPLPAPPVTAAERGGGQIGESAAAGLPGGAVGPPDGAAAAGRAAVRDAREAAAVTTLAVRRAVGSHLASSLKVYVADCDGTLWDGVVSEDGVRGVTFGAERLALHGALAKLQRAGRLLCLASKNDEDDVLDVFRMRAAEEMGLQLEQLSACTRVHSRMPELHPLEWLPAPHALLATADSLPYGTSGRRASLRTRRTPLAHTPPLGERP